MTHPDLLKGLEGLAAREAVPLKGHKTPRAVFVDDKWVCADCLKANCNNGCTQ